MQQTGSKRILKSTKLMFFVLTSTEHYTLVVYNL